MKEAWQNIILSGSVPSGSYSYSGDYFSETLPKINFRGQSYNCKVLVNTELIFCSRRKGAK